MTSPVLTSEKVKKPLPTDGPLCLNLGGAGEGFLSGRIPGFITVDLRDVDDTDIVSDISDLSWTGDGTVDQIYCSNALEHFPIHKTKDVLAEWHRVMKPGGKLFVSVPDFDANVKIYLKTGLTAWLQYLIWGDQKAPLNYHYINFTFATLAGLLDSVGFKGIKRVQKFPFGVEDASVHKDNWFQIPISLNMEAVK
ncbi:MAG TPA: methyltransferase domain-containing protein [Elusimicrobiota bacterium]|jgi:Uncharacterized protein conserved in bacteria|nr:methyltransferase domain-containing protein [Elusimicrobiota bacterium]HNC58474.1 methyltransferase domain-containing protein [Leptospiraceae bacterium]